MKIYVGNMPFTMEETALNEMFSKFGEVESVKVITDRETNRPRGFAFVEMDDDGGRQAISTLSGQMVEGRALNVNEARPRENRGGRRNNSDRW
jgi:RNA recognition motif-containing protein